MVRTAVLLLVSLVLAGWSVSAQAGEDESRALILKAMKAHGGKELLQKYRAAEVKYKGTVEIMGMKAKLEGEVTVFHPDRMKNVISMQINDKNLEFQQGFDGKVLWISFLGKTQEFKDKEQIQDLKEGMYGDQVAGLADLDGKEYKFSPLGEMKIKDRAAVGVRVSREGKRDVNLWFDKNTNLLVKSEYRAKDPFTQTPEATQEKYFLDYKVVMGLQTPGRLEVHSDGKKMADMELTNVRYHERLDDTYFAKP